MNQRIGRYGTAAPVLKRPERWLLAGVSSDRIAVWLVTLTILVLSYRFTDSINLAITITLVQVVARSMASLLMERGDALRTAPVLLAAILRTGAIAGLMLVDGREDLWWALALVALIGIASGIIEDAHNRLTPGTTTYRALPTLNRRLGRTEKVTALAAPLLAAGCLAALDERSAFALAAVASYVTLFTMRRLLMREQTPSHRGPVPSYSSNPFYNHAWTVPGEARLIIAGLAIVAAAAVVIRVVLLEAVLSDFGYSEAAFGLMIALVAIGALAGPPPIDKLLVHFPVGLVVAGGVASIVIAAVFAGYPAPVFLLVPVLVAAGTVIATLDAVAFVTFLRTIPEHRMDAVNRSARRLMQIGQFGTLIALLVLADLWGVTYAALVLSGVGILAIGLHFVQSGGLGASGRVSAPAREQPASSADS